MLECKPKYKSLKNIAAKGIKQAINLLLIIAPENTAIPRIGVKFGGCGSNLATASNTIMPMMTQ